MTESSVMPPLGQRLHFSKTKIIATIGPASATRAMLRALVLTGVDVFRLNFAHGAYDFLEGIVRDIRSLEEELMRPIGILGDLSGPKIRLEKIPGDEMFLSVGDPIEFVRSPGTGQPGQLTCTYEALIDDLRVGNQVLLADGAAAMKVVAKLTNPERVVCEVTHAGKIKSRQGVNLPGAKLSTPSLTEKDREDLAWAVKAGLDYVGLSFVRQATDIRDLQQAIDSHQVPNPPHIVAKIEKEEAIADLEGVLQLTDAVMVARGDLGVEVDIATVPVLQKRIIRRCNQHRIPVITATQMLDSMQSHNRPTRAEASDVANAVLDGSDAVMLSGETAVGEFPVETVRMMCRLAHEAEKLNPHHARVDSFTEQARLKALEVTEAVTHGAGVVAEMLHADLIVVATHSGRTAMAVSKQRLMAPILGLTDSVATARRMTLYWGVIPQVTRLVDSTPRELLEYVSAWGLKQEILRSGSKVVLVATSNWSTAGHDLLLVHAIP